MMITEKEYSEFSKVFTESSIDEFSSRKEFIVVMKKLNIAKLEFTMYKNGLPGEADVIYCDAELTPSTTPLYERKHFNYGFFELRTYLSDGVEITEKTKEELSLTAEITYLGVSRLRLVDNALHNLYHDELTGVYNHNYFLRHVDGLIKSKTISKYTALYLNISKCRYLNTIFGSRITDQIIITLARDLDAMTEPDNGECLSRLGGDFFTLIVLKEHVSKFLDKFEKFPIECDYETDHISYNLVIKAGISVLDDSYTSVDSVMASISAAHSISKNTVGQSIVYFTPALFANNFANESLIDELSADLNASRLMVYYQPCIHFDGTNRTINGAEALLRWRRKEEMVIASDIIPLAEETKLIMEIDLYVINKVCTKITQWKAAGYKTPPVSCNLSIMDLKFNNMTESIIDIIKSHNVEFSDITFEFSEAAYEQEPELINSFIKEMKKYGIRIGIEDYSNSFLPFKIFTESGFDYIKIDYGKINTNDKKMLTILDSVIELTKTLGIDIIIKNIHDEDVISKYVQNGCHSFQSEHFEKPLSERFFENRLKNQ